MVEIRIERRHGPMLWVWLIGLVVLALLIWGIAELVNTDRDNQTMAAADTTGTAPASAASDGAAPGPTAPATEQAAPVGPASLEDLLPLGVQDVGQQVTANGTVLSSPTGSGFWLNAGGNLVIWVSGNLKVTQGQAVQGIQGTLRRASSADVSSWMGSTDIQKQATGHPYWQLQTGVYLDASAPAPAVRAATKDTTPAAAHRRRGRRPVAGRRRASR